MKYSKWKTAMIKRLGSEKAYNEYMTERGRKGGSKSNPNKGFGADRERASLAGHRGGSVARVRDGK